jgi:hypothetical protein
MCVLMYFTVIAHNLERTEGYYTFDSTPGRE